MLTNSSNDSKEHEINEKLHYFERIDEYCDWCSDLFFWEVKSEIALMMGSNIFVVRGSLLLFFFVVFSCCSWVSNSFYLPTLTESLQDSTQCKQLFAFIRALSCSIIAEAVFGCVTRWVLHPLVLISISRTPWRFESANHPYVGNNTSRYTRTSFFRSRVSENHHNYFIIILSPPQDRFAVVHIACNRRSYHDRTLLQDRIKCESLISLQSRLNEITVADGRNITYAVSPPTR